MFKKSINSVFLDIGNMFSYSNSLLVLLELVELDSFKFWNVCLCCMYIDVNVV